MEKTILTINQLIEIEIKRETNTGELVKESFSSRIEDKDRNFLYLAHPLKNGYPFPVRNQENIMLKVVYQQNAYIGQAKAIDTITSPLLLLKVTIPEKLTKIQERNWVRHPCILPVNYQLLDSEDSPIFKDHSLDISGGGMLLQTKEAFDINTPLQVEFSLDGCTMNIKSKVVRSIPADQRFKTAIEFEDISERDRERIIRYIFQKQRELLRKDLL